ncbi:transposase [Rhizosphaericola mali]|uniref:transposase n=1 Tax=Rhizosphaericola mali TaxID=2545455 RepID=UPI00389B2F0F
MRKQQFTATQIAQVLKEYSNGKSVEELNREYGVSKVTIYNWRKKYGGMDASEMKRIKEREEENQSLKHMYALSGNGVGRSQIHHRKKALKPCH